MADRLGTRTYRPAEDGLPLPHPALRRHPGARALGLQWLRHARARRLRGDAFDRRQIDLGGTGEHRGISSDASFLGRDRHLKVSGSGWEGRVKLLLFAVGVG